MLFEIFMITLSAFAVYGLYCIGELILVFMARRHSPKSVTIMLYQKDMETYSKIRYLQNNVFNNEIILLTDDTLQKNIYTDFILSDKRHLLSELQNLLFTKTDG